MVEGYDRISQNIAHVYLTTSSQDFRVFSHHQPSNVGEEESTIAVVRVGVGLGVLVMNSVVTDPVENGVLSGMNNIFYPLIFIFHESKMFRLYIYSQPKVIIVDDIVDENHF